MVGFNIKPIGSIVIFFIVSKLPKPFVNAVVPTVAYLISTMTVPLIKKWWLNKIK